MQVFLGGVAHQATIFRHLECSGNFGGMRRKKKENEITDVIGRIVSLLIPNLYVEVLIPPTQNVTLYGNKVIADVIKVMLLR